MYTHTHTHTHTYIYIYVCMYVYISVVQQGDSVSVVQQGDSIIYIYIYIYIYTHIYVYTHTHTHTDTHTHIYMYVCMYKYLASQVAQTVKNLPTVQKIWVISESRRSPGKGNGNPRQHSSLENSMDRGVWSTIVHGIAKIVSD